LIRFFTQDVKPPLPPAKEVKKWLVALIVSHGHRCGDINIVFCTDEYLLSFNKQFLNHDTLTDIITFQDSVEGPGKSLILQGELYISFNSISRNAAKFQVSEREELLRVIAHGVLHLCGFKDKNPADKRKMRLQENLALDLFKSSQPN